MSRDRKTIAEARAEAKSLFYTYKNMGYSDSNAKLMAKNQMLSRHAGDGKFLNILYWLIKFGLLFIFL